MKSSYCWRAFNHSVAFCMFIGVSQHCGGCKCISSMPNVCCAGHHWFSHKFYNDNYFLFSPARVCLKEQLSIFTTQAILELPKVARNSNGNSFIPGLSPLAGILLNHYCRLTVTCVHLCTVDLYPITCKLIYQPKWVVCEHDKSSNVCTYTIKAVFDTYVFGTCARLLCHSGHWSSFMKYTQSDYSTCTFGIVLAVGYGKYSSFLCTDPEHQFAAAVSLLLKLK